MYDIIHRRRAEDGRSERNAQRKKSAHGKRDTNKEGETYTHTKMNAMRNETIATRA